jgi:enoyl-CoA hydratase/carnithine racemase
MFVDSWIDGPIGHVQLARPAERNALDRPTLAELRAAIITVAAADNVRCLVLTGQGESFSAGGDLPAIQAQTVEETIALNEQMIAAAADLDALTVPTIAALHGHALGGGLELALACTLRVAEVGTRLGFPEVRIGLIPAGGGIARLPRVVARGVATRMLLTGDSIGADEALRVGLVDAVAQPSALDATVAELARRIAANGPLAVRAIREILSAGDAAALGEPQANSETRLPAILASADFREGLASFAERRPATFHGR